MSRTIYVNELKILDENSSVVGQINHSNINRLVSLNSENSFNQVNSIYNDIWINQNLINQPPAPGLTGGTEINVNVIQNSSTIGFLVQNPEQIAYGSMLIPYINSVNISLGGTGGIGTGDTNILTDNSTYLPSNDNPIEAIVLSKIASTGYVKSYSYSDGVIRPTYVYGNSNMDSFIKNDKIYVNLWFKNTNNKSTDYNVLTVPLGVFLEAFPPSTVRNVSSSGITQTAATFSWTAPLYTNKDPNSATGDNSSTINQYKIQYDSLASPQRYSYVPHNGSIETGNSITSRNLTLKPGTQYNVGVSAQNSVVSTYGPSGTTQITTVVPTVPTLPSSLTVSLPSSQYHGSLKNASNNSIVSVPIYQYNNSGGDLGSITNLAIHNSITIGSGNTGLSAISILLDTIEQTKYEFNGFGNQGGTGWISSNISGFKASFKNISVSDWYSGDSTNFYNKVSSITPFLNLNNGTPLSASSTLKTINIKYTNDKINYKEGSSNFYIDDLNGGPTGIVDIISNNLLTKKITGIEICGDTSSSQFITYIANLYNIGKNFYRSDKILEITGNSNISVSNNIISDLDGNSLPNITFNNKTFNFNFTASTITPLYEISFKPTVYNYFTTSGSSYIIPNIVIGITMDYQSYNKVFNSSVQNIGGSSYGGSYRIVSPIVSVSGSYNYSGGYIQIDNTKSLITDYSNELPIITGKYATPSFNSTYLTNNGLNGLTTENKFRYSTFVWSVNPSYNGNISIIRFKFDSFSNNSNLSYDAVSNSITTSGNIVVYYRIEQYNSNDNTIYQPGASIPGGIENYSTVWINANVNEDTSFQTNSRITSNNTAVSGLISNSSSTEINNPNNSSFTYNVRGFSLTPSSLNLSNMRLRVYFMVGIKSNINLSFNDINCRYND